MIAPQLQCYLFDASVALTGNVSAVCGAGESPLVFSVSQRHLHLFSSLEICDAGRTRSPHDRVEAVTLFV
jgi:hypothetical protein